MEAAHGSHHLAAPGGEAGKLQRRLDRFGAGVAEEDALQTRRQAGQFLHQRCPPVIVIGLG